MIFAISRIKINLNTSSGLIQSYSKHHSLSRKDKEASFDTGPSGVDGDIQSSVKQWDIRSFDHCKKFQSVFQKFNRQQL